MVTPIAFMVMPYGDRETGVGDGTIPSHVDFDKLWKDVYGPVLRDLGYRLIRADCDLGALIITDMIKRLVFADLVVADISLPNPNVYYEAGLRHAARETGCILTAASWAKPAFDLAQVRHVRFDLPDGGVPDDVAENARRQLHSGLRPLLYGRSPVHESVTGYPTQDIDDVGQAVVFADLSAELAEFETDVGAVRLAARDQQATLAGELVDKYGQQKAVRDLDAVLLLRLLRDVGSWSTLLKYAAKLPDRLQRHPVIIEYRALALSKSGDPLTAAAELKQLITQHGPTSERWGLLGGRYKQLARDAARKGNPTDAARYLNDAIDSYRTAMDCDLNDYYPSSNLPALYRQRGRMGDEALAVQAATVAYVACERAAVRNPDDIWLRPTLLGLAFHRGDVGIAAELAVKIADEGHAEWSLETTLDDISATVEQQPDPDIRKGLKAILGKLTELIPPPPAPPARVRSTADLPKVLTRLGLSTGRRVVVSVGGAAGLTGAVLHTVSELFRSELVPIINHAEATVVDGGTDSGVMRLMGAARWQRNARFPLIGVAAIGTVALPGEPAPADAAELDRRHSHTILVPGVKWGDESPWISAVASDLAGDQPSLTLLINGGEIAYSDVQLSLDANRPVLVFAGTGRTADAIAGAGSGESDDPRALTIAASPLVHVVDVEDSTGIGDIIRELLRIG